MGIVSPRILFINEPRRSSRCLEAGKLCRFASTSLRSWDGDPLGDRYPVKLLLCAIIMDTLDLGRVFELFHELKSIR